MAQTRCIILTCNDFQGDDPDTIRAVAAAAKLVKKSFDVSLQAAKQEIGRPLTNDEKLKMRNMTVTVKIMKVDI